MREKGKSASSATEASDQTMPPQLYRPTIGQFCSDLKGYASLGIKYFKELDKAAQDKIRTGLSGQLEDNEAALEYRLSQVKQGKKPRFNFIPMPEPGGSDFTAAFFRPHICIEGKNGGYSCSFTLLMWVGNENAACAVRLEPSERKGAEHRYAHLQLTPDILGVSCAFAKQWPAWTPDSYPAFPLGYAHPVQLFLSIAIAVHGRDTDTGQEVENQKQKEKAQKRRRRRVRETIREAMGSQLLGVPSILSEIEQMMKC